MERGAERGGEELGSGAAIGHVGRAYLVHGAAIRKAAGGSEEGGGRRLAAAAAEWGWRGSVCVDLRGGRGQLGLGCGVASSLSEIKSFRFRNELARS
jgi:hypothetical protein